MLDLDLASEDFLVFERDLKKRKIRWVTSTDDAQRMRALAAGWGQEYRPRFLSALGEIEPIVRMDEDVKWLRGRCGVRTDAGNLRTALRRMARRLSQEILPAYDANRWSVSAKVQEADNGGPLLDRLIAFDGAIAESYQQALTDLGDDNRRTYVGPASELREVLGVSIRRLSPPDDEIVAEPWFKGHNGKPTQAERIRAILGSKERSAAPSRTLEIIDAAIGSVARSTYNRASAVTHLGRVSSRDEVSKLQTWVEAVLGEILPDA